MDVGAPAALDPRGNGTADFGLADHQPADLDPIDVLAILPEPYREAAVEAVRGNFDLRNSSDLVIVEIEDDPSRSGLIGGLSPARFGDRQRSEERRVGKE